MSYGKIQDYAHTKDTLTLSYERALLSIQQMNTGVLRFSTSPERKSSAVVEKPVGIEHWSITKEKDTLIVSIKEDHPAGTEDMELHIGTDFYMDIYVDGKPICCDYRGGQTKAEGVAIRKTLGEDDAIYGLGDKIGPLNKRGYSYVSRNAEETAPPAGSALSLYRPIPFFIVLKENSCYGILADPDCRTTFDFGKESKEYYSVRYEKGEPDYYFIAGKNPGEILARYVDLTGHAALPQRRLFDYPQGGEGYDLPEDVWELKPETAGDTQTHIPPALEQICSLGLCGIMMSGCDMGSFGDGLSPELMIRFFQSMVFSPLLRESSIQNFEEQKPLNFDEATARIIRHVIRLRYRFLPYLYDLAHACVQTGAPILRPLVYEYPYDKQVRNLTDQYMLGPQVLVAPVTESGKTERTVYLPEGQWYDFFTGRRYEGSTSIRTDAPLDYIPMYVKAGALLPLCERTISSADELRAEDITLYAYPGTGAHIHYSDDGEADAYEEGNCKIVLYRQSPGGEVTREVIHDGYNEKDPSIQILTI